MNELVLPWHSALWSHRWDFSWQKCPYRHQKQIWGCHPESSDRHPIFLVQTAEKQSFRPKISGAERKDHLPLAQ